MESQRRKIGRPKLDKPMVIKSVRLSPRAWALRDKLAESLKVHKHTILETALEEYAARLKIHLK